MARTGVTDIYRGINRLRVTGEADFTGASITSIGTVLDGAFNGTVGATTPAAITGTTITGTSLVATGVSGVISIFAGGDNNSYLQNTSAGSIVFRTNNGTAQFHISHTASAVEYVQVTGAASGGNPTLSAQGASSALNLRLTGKGSGEVRVTPAVTILDGTSIPAGGTVGAGYKFSSAGNFGVFFGSGAPSLAAAQGSLYLRSDGTTTNNRAYINSDGSTTWTALTTAA